MNKKFFTLFAVVAMLFTAFTVNAADIAKTDKYVYLTDGTNYLAVSGVKADSLVVVDDPSAEGRASIDSALWTVSTSTTVLGDVFSFKNKKTGAVLTLPLTQKIADIKMSMPATGVSQFKVESGVISSKFTLDGAKNKDLALAVVGGELTLAATGTAFSAENPSVLTLKAADLGDGFTVFSLNFGEAYSENIFDDVELIAKDLTGADAGYVTLQEVGKEKSTEGTKKDLFFGLDTLKYTIGGQTQVHGFKFVQDTTYAKGVNAAKKRVHVLGNANFQKFQFVLDPATDKVSMSVKDAPFAGTPLTYASETTDITPIKVVYAQVLSSKVLTVTGAGSAATVQGSAPSITLSKGTPAKLDGGTGVYIISTKSGNTTKYLYAGSDGTFVLDTKKPTTTQPAGQFYVVEKDGKYQFVDRNFNYALTTAPAQIYSVTDKAGAYRIDHLNTAVASEFYFTKLDVKAGGKPYEYHYLATKKISKEDQANKAFTLNLKSGTIGVEDLYTFVNDTTLVIKGQTEAKDAAKFKVEQAFDGKVYSGLGAEHSAGVGALSLGDTLARSGYYLKQQFTNRYVAVDLKEPNNLILPKTQNTNPRVIFTFEATEKEGFYTLNAGAPFYLDVNTGLLVPGTTVNFFDLVPSDAPDYANVGEPSHKIVKSAEDDSKALSMNPTTNFAELKRADQAPYKDSLFGLWVDTAYMKDAGKPLYYISTQNTLTEEEKADGIRYYLVNPMSLKMKDGTVVIDGNDYFDQNQGEFKAAFVKGIEVGDDTLKIFKDGLKADEDLYFKRMDLNPAAMAFLVTENGSLKIENTTFYDDYVEDHEWYCADVTYLKVVNNVLYWSYSSGYYADNDNFYNGDPALGHDFTIEATDLYPTDNENPEAGFEVYSAEGGIVVTGAAGAVANITNVLGQTVATLTIGSDYEPISAPAGIVFVTINGETVKAIVK